MWGKKTVFNTLCGDNEAISLRKNEIRYQLHAIHINAISTK